jgi:hypothetical protein
MAPMDAQSDDLVTRLFDRDRRVSLEPELSRQLAGFQGSSLLVTADACTAFLGQLVEAASDDDADRISRQDAPGAE